MNKNIVATTILGILVCAPSALAQSRAPQALPEGPGKALVETLCSTCHSIATIGKLDPISGTVTEYKTQARDPHSATFHPNGNLYFTAQGAGMLGREVLRDARCQHAHSPARSR